MPLFNPSSSFEKLREVAIQERIRNQLERRHMVPLATALTMAANAAATAYEESGTMSAVDRAMQPASERLRLALRRVYFDSINTMKTHAIGELPQKTLTVLIERKDLTGAIDAVLTAWVRTRTAEKVKRITRTTRNTIKAVIADAVAQGLGQSEVASSIATKLKSFTRARAKMIARTETHSAMQSSSLTVAEIHHHSSRARKNGFRSRTTGPATPTQRRTGRRSD